MISEHTNFRIKAFKSGWAEICRVILPTSTDATTTIQPLRPQLGLDQPHLLAWALLEYRVESERRMKEYMATLESLEAVKGKGAINGSYFQGAEVSGKMNDQTVRYAELLEHIEKTWTGPEQE
jgi:hypothetical protein